MVHKFKSSGIEEEAPEMEDEAVRDSQPPPPPDDGEVNDVLACQRLLLIPYGISDDTDDLSFPPEEIKEEIKSDYQGVYIPGTVPLYQLAADRKPGKWRALMMTALRIIAKYEPDRARALLEGKGTEEENAYRERIRRIERPHRLLTDSRAEVFNFERFDGSCSLLEMMENDQGLRDDVLHWTEKFVRHATLDEDRIRQQQPPENHVYDFFGSTMHLSRAMRYSLPPKYSNGNFNPQFLRYPSGEGSAVMGMLRRIPDAVYASPLGMNMKVEGEVHPMADCLREAYLEYYLSKQPDLSAVAQDMHLLTPDYLDEIKRQRWIFFKDHDFNGPRISRDASQEKLLFGDPYYKPENGYKTLSAHPIKRGEIQAMRGDASHGVDSKQDRKLINAVYRPLVAAYLKSLGKNAEDVLERELGFNRPQVRAVMDWVYNRVKSLLPAELSYEQIEDLYALPHQKTHRLALIKNAAA